MNTSFPGLPLRPRLCDPQFTPSIPLIDGHLHAAVYLDDGVDERPVTEEDCKQWGTTLSALMEVACERLRAESSPLDWCPVDTVPGMLLLAGGDGHASNRMLIFEEMFQDLPLGGVAIVVPSQDQILAVPLSDVTQLDALHTMFSAAFHANATSTQPLTDQAFWTDGKSWRHVELFHGEEETEVEPPDDMLDAIGRVASMGLVAIAGEA